MTPLKEVKESISQQLQQKKKNEAMTKWVDDLKKDYEDKVSYAVGFTPPPGHGHRHAPTGRPTTESTSCPLASARRSSSCRS